jgi:hypothetical protein
MNRLDELCVVVCSLSIIFGIMIYDAIILKITSIEIIFWILLGIINGCFILLMLYMLFEGYLSKFGPKVDIVREKIKEKYPDITKKHRCCEHLLLNRSELQKRARFQWAKLRYETKKVIKARR